jgi:hypothetical protein
MKNRIDTLIVIIATVGCFIASCGSVSKEIEEQTKNDSAGYGNGGEDTVEMRDARAEDRVKFRRAANARIAENEKRLADIRTANATKADSMQLRKKWETIASQNTLIQQQLNSFNETLDTNWVLFTTKIDSSLKVVASSLNTIDTH